MARISSRAPRAGSNSCSRASPRSTMSRGNAAMTASTAWCSISACRRCSSIRPSAAFPSATTARSTCAWARNGPSAADLIATISERDLANVIFLLGEERHSRAVARAIVAERQKNPIVTTGALADIVGRVVRSKPGAIHPATRTFQALRLFVNEELSELAAALAGRRAHPARGRAAVRRVVPFAGRPDRQNLSRRSGSQGHFAPCAGAGSPRRRVHGADQKAGRAGRRRNREQSARAFGQAARRRAHRWRGRADRYGRRCCRGFRRSPT